MINADFKKNSFDIVRLFAALQVVFAHSCSILNIQSNNAIFKLFSEFVCFFPGVPIFFLISGMLISASYINSKTVKQYTINRLLRIYPALFLVFLVSLLILFLTGYYKTTHISLKDMIFWAGTQLTFLQFYNPPFLRGFATGVMNGALWTISIELQFYFILPILLYFLSRKSKKINLFLGALIIMGYILMLLDNAFMPAQHSHVSHNWAEYLSMTVLPYLWMFLIGVFINYNFEFFLSFIKGKFWLFLIAYLSLCFAFNKMIALGDRMNFFMFLLLSLVIIGFSYNYKELSKRYLRQIDISYGVYLFHMLVINLLFQYHLTGKMRYLFSVFGFTMLCALFSWFFIEKPCLRLKGRALRKI